MRLDNAKVANPVRRGKFSTAEVDLLMPKANMLGRVRDA